MFAREPIVVSTGLVDVRAAEDVEIVDLGVSTHHSYATIDKALLFHSFFVSVLLGRWPFASRLLEDPAGLLYYIDMTPEWVIILYEYDPRWVIILI